MFRRTFPSYDAAQAACEGYQARDLVAVVVTKTRAYVPPFDLTAAQAFSLGALASASGDPVRVLDVGGAAGAHYRLARALLPASTRLDWLVLETAEMVQQAKALETDELHFAVATTMHRPDLLHLSGVLQYLPDPMASLERLLSARPEQVLISRMALGKGEITIQRSRLKDNGHGPLPAGFKDREVRYPHTSLRMGDVLAALDGYTVLATFEGGLLARR